MFESVSSRTVSGYFYSGRRTLALKEVALPLPPKNVLYHKIITLPMPLIHETAFEISPIGKLPGDMLHPYDPPAS